MPGTLAFSSCIAGVTKPSKSPLKSMGITYFPFHVSFPGSNSLPASTKSVQKTQSQMGQHQYGKCHTLPKNKKWHSHLYDNWLGPLPIKMKLPHPSTLFSLSLVCPFDSGTITSGKRKHSKPLPLLSPFFSQIPPWQKGHFKQGVRERGN